MRTKITTVCVSGILLLFLLMATNLSWAAEDSPDDKDDVQTMVRMPMWGILDAELPDEIALTDQQKEQIKDIWRSYKQQADEIRERAGRARGELLEMLKQKMPREQIQALRDKIVDMDFELSDLLATIKGEIYSVLTDEQLAFLIGDFTSRFRGLDVTTFVGAGSSYRGGTGGPSR